MKKMLAVSAVLLFALAFAGCAADPAPDEPASETEAITGRPGDCEGGWYVCPITGSTWDWGTCDNPSQTAVKKLCETHCPDHSLFHAQCVVGGTY